MVENLIHPGFEVTLVEMSDQVLPPVDVEHARVVEAHLKRHGAKLALGDGVAGFSPLKGGAIEVQSRSWATHPADLVILALGVRHDTTLAKSAELELGARGGIRIDDRMRTSDPDIFAVGDAVEVEDFVTGERALVAPAGPANRQGRIAADVVAGRDSRFRGTQGTAIVGLFGEAVAWTGASQKALKRMRMTDFEKIYIYPNSHAGYYPGAEPILMKVLVRRSDGRLLGAQALGEDNVDKRISALAVGIQMGATVYDLKEAEVCYAPRSAVRRTRSTSRAWWRQTCCAVTCRWCPWTAPKPASCSMCAIASNLRWRTVPEAVNIPIGQLRDRLGELPRDREINVICRSGQQAYIATRFLAQHGFKASTLSGGMLSLAHNYLIN